jgi:UDP-N-acetylglucosamine--N-acetylmuramyl-(pentapeptide) pyrophosphoryl-undecaprenol N-acetylglucosamine transferase
MVQQTDSQKRLMLAASSGGHLLELVRQLPHLDASDDSLWVTFSSAQSKSLLAGRRVMYVPYVRPRDYRGVLRTMRLMRGILRRERFDGAVSTGSAIALAVLPVARLAGVPTTYIESVCRVNGPSTTGRLLELTRTAELRTQHGSWAGKRWREHPSVLSTYSQRRRGLDVPPSTLFVTLGTIQGYRFDKLVDAVLATGLANENTVWQLGFTTGRTDLPGRVYEYLSTEEFERFSIEADVVVTHAGVGTLLGLLERGVFPVMVVRRSDRREHVDDHQAQIADLVNSLGIGIAVEADELDESIIQTAMLREIVNTANANFGLDELNRSA